MPSLKPLLMNFQAYNIIAQRDSQIMTGLGEAARNDSQVMRQLGVAARDDSQVMKELGKAAREDSGAMKTIAVVTMAFLPPTFLSVSVHRQCRVVLIERRRFLV